MSLFLCLVFSILIISPAPIAYAADKSKTDKANETDEKVQELKDQIASLDKDIADSKAKQAELQKEMEAANEPIAALQSQIGELQTEILAYDMKLNALNSQVQLLDEQIAETEAQMSEQKMQIAATQKLLGERVRAMYMAGNVPLLEIVLTADSFENLLTRLELASQVSRHDNKIVDALKEQIADLENMKSALEKDKNRLEESKAEISSAKNAIEFQRSIVNSRLELLNSYVASLEKDSEELRAIQKKDQQLRLQYVNDMFRMVGGGASTGNGNVKGMIWPVPYKGSYISSDYGERAYNESASFHYGIDITMGGAGNNDKRIVASADGIVREVFDACTHNYRKSSNCGCNTGYGNYIIIDHGDGLLAWYAHLGSVTVSVGQTVAKGEDIGIMGCTGFSTGPHLHFEIRVNGTKNNRELNARNPLEYVSR